MNRITYHTTPLGRVMLAAKGDALAGLWIEGQKYFADGLKGKPGNRTISRCSFRPRNGSIGILPARNLVYQS